MSERRVALVTGGASGFGLDIARALHRDGSAVVIADVNAAAVDEAVTQLGSPALGLAVDVGSVSQMDSALQRVEERFGALDTLVISAGVFHIGGLSETSEADWDRVIDVNLKGAFTTIRAAESLLVDSERGRIVTIGSDCGRRGSPGQVPYSASKFGLVGLTQAVASELAPHGVTANCVCPVGCPSTAMGQEVLAWKTAQAGLSADVVMARTARANPLGRNATEGDVTHAVRYFLSEGAGFITGVTLDVDGGAALGTVPGVGDV